MVVLYILFRKNVNVAEEEITKLKETLQRKEESERQLQGTVRITHVSVWYFR